MHVLHGEGPITAAARERHQQTAKAVADAFIEQVKARLGDDLEDHSPEMVAAQAFRDLAMGDHTEAVQIAYALVVKELGITV